MKTILFGTYYQILNLVRVKKAVFFTFIFPAFLFILFSIVWGTGNITYTKFLLTGVIVLTIASDAIFSIGTVISGYYLSGEIKLFKVLPYSFTKHLFSLILSRVILLAIAILVLIAIAIIFFSVTLSLNEIAYFSFTVILGTIVFSLVGIVLAYISREDSNNTNLTNICFYAMMFLSNCFYPLTELKSGFIILEYVNPFNPILNIARNGSGIIAIFAWISILLIIQLFLYSSIEIKR